MTTKTRKPSVRSLTLKLRVANKRIADLEASVERTRVENPEVKYWQDVRDMAEEFDKLWNEGEWETREEALDWLRESIDGCHRIIYTYAAQECLRYSKNDGAYIEDLGTDGLIENGGINWSGMAYCAFECDILDQIEADVNEDPPAPKEK